MRRVTLILPDALHERAQALAEKNRVSIDALVAAALAEKLLALRSGCHAAAQGHTGAAWEHEEDSV